MNDEIKALMKTPGFCLQRIPNTKIICVSNWNAMMAGAIRHGLISIWREQRVEDFYDISSRLKDVKDPADEIAVISTPALRKMLRRKEVSA